MLFKTFLGVFAILESLKYKIKSETGIHARPASFIADLAKRFSDVSITIFSSDKQCDAKSILSIMKLGIKQNDEVVFNLDGPGESVLQVKNELDNLFDVINLKLDNTSALDNSFSR